MQEVSAMLPPASSVDLSPAESAVLARYLAGWAEADPVAIASAVADTYRLRDPLVGTFTRRTLPRYFERVRSAFAFASAAPTRRADCGFVLRGPMEVGYDARSTYWREATALGLTGSTRIVITPYGIMADVVAYDLNLASDLLRRCAAREADVLDVAPAA
jgi:hypothetical protein